MNSTPSDVFSPDAVTFLIKIGIFVTLADNMLGYKRLQNPASLRVGAIAIWFD